MTRRRITLGALFAGVALAGCGGGAHFSDRVRPALPVNVSVYVNDQRISVAPSSVSPGSIAITIANQSSSAQSVEVSNVGTSHVLTTTGPISPQATDQVTLNLPSGDYSVAIAPNNSSQAAAATPSGVVPATLTVQGQRSNSNNQLLQP